jgi:hypothetical protein
MARKTIAIVCNAALADAPVNTNGLVTLAPDFVVPEAALANVSSVNIGQVPGGAGSVAITFSGTYAAGDQAKVTISSNLTSRQKFRKTYTVDVVAGATTVTNIAASLVSKIQREIDAGLIDYPFASVGNVAGVVTVTQKGDDSHGLEVFVYATSSNSGAIGSVITQTTISEGQPSDLTDAGIPADKITEANYSTVLVPYNAQVAQPFIDSKGEVATNLKIYAKHAGYAAQLETLIGNI